MPSRERPTKARGCRGPPHPDPPGPGPPACAPHAHGAHGAHGAHAVKPRRIVFQDELPARAPRGALSPVGAPPARRTPRPDPVPDYELKYPSISSERERSRYAAVFQDQYGEFLQLQQELGCVQARLRRLEALLAALPPPRSQREAQAAARVWRELDRKRTDPGLLDKQARCCYLKGKLRHLKGQIRKFQEQQDSEGSVYF
ncbi:occludin/ELL domain-containing protein 1 [Ochotona princeps]|uniref:occludin/ELL domain-containing protein 1 n=1 Tax=Ochotona princeps TaxID=9978 RepID=UPI0027152F95|nr:occludin/ELL domain-containing protein 1 [Ochotona princeps]